MKIGIGLPNVIPGTEGRRLVGWAQRAEEFGFDSLGVIDRVVYDSYEATRRLADRDQANLDLLRRRLGRTPLIEVPHLPDDVHDLAGLRLMDGYLFA